MNDSAPDDARTPQPDAAQAHTPGPQTATATPNTDTPNTDTPNSDTPNSDIADSDAAEIAPLRAQPHTSDEFPTAEHEPAMTLLLDAYRGRSKTAPAETKGWIRRVDRVPGLADDDLALAHGLAIAADLLEIRVEDAATGLRYRAKAA